MCAICSLDDNMLCGVDEYGNGASSHSGRERSGGGEASPIDEELVRRMRRFARAPALHRLAVLVEASIVGPQDDEAIRQQVASSK